MTQALIVVDIQNDFCPGGALAVPDGDAVIDEANRWLSLAQTSGWLTVASRDWHPSNHCSFVDQGGPWPVHCVQNSHGGAFHPALRLPPDTVVVNKGFEADKEAYSALSGVIDANNKPLVDCLSEHQVKAIYVCGLALDYCVFATGQQALQSGYRVHLILPACRGIDNMASNQRVDWLVQHGAHLVHGIQSCVHPSV